MAGRLYKPDSAGLLEIARSPAVRAAMVEVAEKGKTIAVAMAEQFRSDEDDQHYADSFEVEKDVTVNLRGRYPGPRGAARLVNTSAHAAAVEWGNAHDHKPHHVLAETREALKRG